MSVSVFKEAEKRGHEQVVFFNFPKVGLKAIVGIHNTVLGPALGGCRMRLYEDESQAVEDALRLSEGMTYKSSLAGLDLGGGKSCLIADPQLKAGREALFEQFGICLNNLNGRYITAEDMGTSVEDVMVMRRTTKHAAGFSKDQGGGGDPSPWTARGVFNAVLAACERKFGSQDLSSKHVSVQGVGHVGLYMVNMLRKAGAKVTVCDTNKEALVEARAAGASVVELDQIYDLDCDIYCPCAVGQTVNPLTIHRLKCSIIAGAANNQLSDSSVYGLIEQKDILYCPDFAINSGGVINVAGEMTASGWREDWVTEKVRQITTTTHHILDESEKRRKFPEIVAVELAKERIARKSESTH